MEIFKLFGSIYLKSDEADKSLDKINQKGKKTGSMFDGMIGTIGKWGLAAGAAIGVFAVGMGVKAVNSSEDLQKALNGLQSETGTADKEMQGMRDTLLEIYNNNFGESFDDIAKTMGNVKQATGLAGEELKQATTNALMLRDTFEIDTTESIDAVNSLMKNFGIESEKAFELIAVGAQNGANKNGDLVTILSEYSPAFSSIGLSAEQFTQTLINGAETGAFQIDKVGDAVKEFGIRSKDMSDSSAEAYATLGLNADTMFKAFAEGGAQGQQAFATVVEKLSAMEDPLTKNQVGVQLFGTMFEDLEAGVLENFTNIDKTVLNTEGVLSKINSVKYNTFGEAITGIGRQLETGILIPVGDMILPLLNKFANWLNEKMPMIKQLFGTALGFVKEKFEMLTGSLEGNVSPVFKIITEKVIPPLINLFQGIQEKYVPALMRVVEELFPVIETIITNVVGAIVDYVLPPLLALFEAMYTEIMPKVFDIFAKLLPKIQTLWENLWAILEPLLWLLKKTFDLVFPFVKALVLEVLDAIGDAIGVFLDILNGIIGFIAGAFKTNWGQVWEDVKGMFVGIFESMVESGKGLINNLIGYLNKGINALNKLSFSVPDWVPTIGGKSFSLGIPNIPKLAEGGTINKAGSVMVGEEGAEILDLPKGARVTPLDKVKNGITININGATIMGDNDADWLGELLINKLKVLGVTP